MPTLSLRVGVEITRRLKSCFPMVFLSGNVDGGLGGAAVGERGARLTFEID